MAVLGQSRGSSVFDGVVANTNMDALLRDLVGQSIVSQLNLTTPSLDVFGGFTETWSGRRFTSPLETQVSGSFSAAGEGDTIISADKSEFTEYEVLAKYIYGQMALTGQVMNATRNNKGALRKAISVETDGLLRAFRHQLQRMFWGNGVGFLAKATASSLTVTMDLTVASPIPTDTRHLLVGMKVAWGTTGQLAANGNESYGYISKVDSSTTFTVVNSGGGASPDTADYLVMGDANVNSYNKEMMGMGGIEDATADLQAVLIASYPSWVPNILHANAGGGVGVDLTQDLMLRKVNQFVNVNGDQPDCILAHYNIQNEYIKTVSPDVRYMPQKMIGGHKTMAYAAGAGDIMFVWDRYAPYNKLFFLKKSSFRYGWWQKPGWITTGNAGGQILRFVPNGDQAVGIYGAYGNFYTRNRQHCGVLDEVNCTID